MALSQHPVRPGTAIPRRRHQHSLGRLAVTNAELEISLYLDEFTDVREGPSAVLK
ncbi:hypothetical protein [Streptomyces sp. AK02-04a]|uniref:hypothetical protein n=1 Tax=Streptomyces sp. AK02-04a TaxID=3028649 RepID=UPI0039F4807E